MKIKRFQASSMSEALRMVRKEFGEEAVILSAKTAPKTGRLFGRRTDGQVVLTAAIDDTFRAKESAAAAPLEKTAALAEAAGQALNARPNQGISRFLKHFTPITRTGQNKMQPKLSRLIAEAQESKATPFGLRPEASIFQCLREQGLAAALCDELTVSGCERLSQEFGAEENETLSALSHVIEARGWAAPMVPLHSTASRIVVLVGPHGAGKTTTAAKMAARHVLNSDCSVALLSLDHRRIAGASELQRYAAILGVPFSMAAHPEQLKTVLQRLAGIALVIVDTPGTSPSEHARIESLGRLLEQFTEPEVHLLIHTGAQEQVVADTVEGFKKLPVTHLLPTHVDWCTRRGPFFNQLARQHWPIAFVGSGSQVPEGLCPATARQLAALMMGGAPPSGSREHFHEHSVGVAFIPGRPQDGEAGPYVANRHSVIFHERTCKSVSRISNEHVLFFKDPADAMDQGFKPCRMCCMAHFAPKPVERPSITPLVRQQR